MIRKDPAVATALSRIGDRGSWARVKIPTIRRKEAGLYHQSRSLNFIAARARIKPSHRVWVEVVASRLTVYDSDDKVLELAWLQLSDTEVERSSAGARCAEGWDDAGEAGEVGESLAEQKERKKRGRSGVFQADHDVIELWVRLSADTELYRVAIDLDDDGTGAAPDPKAWVDSIATSMSDRASKRGAAQLWDTLAKKLRLVVQLQKQYGDIHEMYGASLSGFREVLIPHNIRHPDSLFSIIWDALQLVLLLMVCYYVPLRTGFDVPVQLWSRDFWQDALIDVYFVLDIIIQFRTAYWDGSGVLVVDTRAITVKYLTGWFPIDFVCVLPLGYIEYFTAADGGNSSFRAVKSLRLLRMGKMMRIAKVYKMIQKYDSIAEMKPLISILALVFLVLLASHLLASFWFMIGVQDQIMVSEGGGAKPTVLTPFQPFPTV